MSSRGLSEFTNQSYISLETFRRNGQGVKTPVWFVEENGVLYVRTGKNTGKYKRVRNNPRVRLAPSNGRGQVKGSWIDGQARILDPAEVARVDRLMSKKYGLMKWLADTVVRLRRRVEYGGFAIQV